MANQCKFRRRHFWSLFRRFLVTFCYLCFLYHTWKSLAFYEAFFSSASFLFLKYSSLFKKFLYFYILGWLVITTKLRRWCLVGPSIFSGGAPKGRWFEKRHQIRDRHFLERKTLYDEQRGHRPPSEPPGGGCWRRAALTPPTPDFSARTTTLYRRLSLYLIIHVLLRYV